MAQGNLPKVSPFDRAALLDRLDGDPELLKEIVAVFLSESAGQMAVLRAALQQGDASRIEWSAHSLKGAAGNVSAAGLRTVACGIEAAARQGDVTSAASMADALDKEYDVLSLELTKTIEGSGSVDE